MNCKYCNGDIETQEPLDDISQPYVVQVATILADKRQLSIITGIGSRPVEVSYSINYCPKCGRKL